MTQSVDLQHRGIYPGRDLGQQPFEVGKEWRVVERPFRCRLSKNNMSITRLHIHENTAYLIVPFLYWQRMRDCQPISVNLEIRTLATTAVSKARRHSERSNRTMQGTRGSSTP